MLLIIYALVWMLVAAAAGILFVTGNFNEMAMTVFGFLFSTLFFAGIVAVLPWWMKKRHSRFSPQKRASQLRKKTERSGDDSFQRKLYPRENPHRFRVLVLFCGHLVFFKL